MKIIKIYVDKLIQLSEGGKKEIKKRNSFWWKFKMFLKWEKLYKIQINTKDDYIKSYNNKK